MKNFKPLVISELQSHLKPRSPDTHKYDFGHVLVIGGCPGMSGAVRMAAEMALYAGAGLVSVATHPDHVAFLNIARPELMVHEVNTPETLTRLLTKATVLVVGPGMTQTPWSEAALSMVAHSLLPKVIDAGALELLKTYQFDMTNCVCTPHPGEAARLLNITAQAIQSDRRGAIEKLVKQYPATWVLKGHGTLIQTQNQRHQCPYGNPGMATAGMGDVLSGLIGALLAQGLMPHDAACLGVAVHAFGGDLLAQQQGERGMLATELFPVIRALLNPTQDRPS